MPRHLTLLLLILSSSIRQFCSTLFRTSQKWTSSREFMSAKRPDARTDALFAVTFSDSIKLGTSSAAEFPVSQSVPSPHLHCATEHRRTDSEAPHDAETQQKPLCSPAEQLYPAVPFIEKPPQGRAWTAPARVDERQLQKTQLERPRATLPQLTFSAPPSLELTQFSNLQWSNVVDVVTS
jgi:hypothetical protein